MNCSKCGVLACNDLQKSQKNLSEFCPMLNQKELLTKKFQDYNQEEIHKIAVNAAKTEAQGYCQWTRLEEIIDFVRKMGYEKIGLAFCIGLIQEAKTTTKILESQGLEVHSVICKTGGIPKENMGLSDQEKVRPGTEEPICNPIGQAELLNENETDLNLILGLCVGHDTLFIKYSIAPVTVFAVKDRVLAHNPLACVYTNYHITQRFPELNTPK